MARATLHHLAILDHDHVMGHGAHHRQVMADKQVGQAVFVLQFAQQRHHLFLHRTVQGRGGFVEQHQRGLEHQGAGNGDALALATGKLMGVTMPAGGVQPHVLEHLDHLRFAVGQAARCVHFQALADDLLHRHARAEAAIGVLEHHLHLLAPWAHLLMVERVQGLTLEANAAAGVEQAQDRLAQGGLAGTGLADNPQGFAALHAEADAVHRAQVGLGPEQPATEGELHAQVIHFQYRLTGLAAQHIARGLGVQQQAAVGMLRCGEQGLAVSLLDDFPGTHHADPLGDTAHQVEVMADQQQRHAQALLQGLEQQQDLALHRHVQRRGGLVGNQQFGLAGQGHGDHHPLALAAGQLMGVGLEPFLGFLDAHQFQQFEDARLRRLAAQALVQQQGFADLLFDAVQRVQGGHRLLEDHGNAVAAQFLQGAW